MFSFNRSILSINAKMPPIVIINQHNKMNAPKKIVIATHIILVIVEV